MVFSILLSIISLVSSYGNLGYVQASFKIDAILENSTVINFYDLPEKYVIDLSNTKVCPWDHCLVKSNNYVDRFILNFDKINKFMSLSGSFRLHNDQTNTPFTPSEIIGASFFCNFDNVIEKNGSAKYVCSDDKGGLTRTFNNTSYRYNFSSSFEIPSKHYILNATGIE